MFKIKFLLIIILLLVMSVGISAQYAGAADRGNPLGNVSMPTVPSNPSVPAFPNVPSGYGSGQGIDLSGLDPVQPGTPGQFENIDLTQRDQTLEQQQNQDNANTNAPTVNNIELPGETPLTNAEIDDYFNQILNSRTVGNPMGDLIRRMPRYGMSFFRNPPSTFAPEDSVPVTQDYRIGVGDEITLTLWGIPEEGNFRVAVNRDGMATIPHIGAVRLAGYTLQEAERIIQARLNQYYTGYQMNLSLGHLRSILVYITGNAKNPGAYTVSSFATLVNALLASGGPSDTGSLRKIELKRNGRTVTIFDMYALLLQGDKSNDARLQAGDVIYIPPVGPLVGLAGEVQRPGVYELNGTTRIKDLLYIAGGLSAQTFRGRIQYYKIFEHAYASALEGTLSELEETVLTDGDILRLYPIYSLTAMATITGPLTRPGSYVIIPGRTRLSEIIERAGGLLQTASDRAEITRVTASLQGPVSERFEINVAEALKGDPLNNITLENNDQITIIVIPEWRPQLRVSITGEVVRPGIYSMLPGEKVSDLITRAGGFTSRAFLRGAVFTRVSVAVEQRRALSQMADRMERDLLETMQNSASAGVTTGSKSNAFNQELARRRELINRLRQLDIMGRVITRVDTPKNIAGTPWDYELQNGDMLRIPDTPLTVNVMGAVYSPSSQLFRPDMSINGYVNAAGGAVKSAHKRMVYLLKGDGTTVRLTRSTSMLSSKKWTAPKGFSATVEPGDTIVVPVKYLDRQSFEAFKDAIDVVYKVAVAVGVVLDATE